MSFRTLGPFEALIFDQDGTLLDAEALHCASWCRVAAEVGLPFDERAFASFAGKGDPSIGAHLAEQGRRAAQGDRQELTGPALALRKRELYRERLDQLQLMPGALSFLRQARAAGMTMAMATISPEPETMRAVQRHGLDQYLDAIVHRDSEVPDRRGEKVRSKPAPDIYLAAAALLGVPPERCCAFEDSLTGVTAAKDAGMTVVAIPTVYSRHFDYSRADAVGAAFEAVAVDSTGTVRVDQTGHAGAGGR